VVFTGCRSHCPDIGPVGVQKPPPAQPITTRYQPPNPQLGVSVVDIELFDAERERRVPLRVYLPATGNDLPVIIFSHGLGSSRAGYQYLGKAWAGQGSIVIHVEHVGSAAGLSLLKLYRASYDTEVWKNRPLDISFVLNMLDRKEPALKAVWERADLTRVGAAGHSFGAQTVLNAAGVLTDFKDGPKNYGSRDDRIDALVILSVPALFGSKTPASFTSVNVPALHMSGTADESPAFETELCHKRIPFDWIWGPPQYFVNMEGAVHRSFAGEEEADGPEIEHYHAMIIEFTAAFWDATLRDDARAKEWLDRVVVPRATVERK
jgi:predicted dienelactone hydrolase